MEIDRMIRRRAIFLYSVVLINGNGDLVLDENFTELLEGFLYNKYDEYAPLFNLIYCFKYNEEKDDFSLYEDESWAPTLFKYLNYYGSPVKIGLVYEGISNGEVDGVSRLAELFCEYINMIFDNKYERRRG